VKFIDEAIITVQSGNGGNGCVSFRREKFIPRGGPDGGDGGEGGDVVFVASLQKRTLYQFQHKKNLKAKNGCSGQGKKKFGKSGDNLVVKIPVGTIVSDAVTGKVVKDFIKPNEPFVIAKGGQGGQGNTKFKSSTHRAPRFAQKGQPCETLTLKLELKFLADVGLIGLPNAGKSTLISSISSARPKIGNYPFTTLTPSLGVVQTDHGEPFIVADIPGLIQGAHKGAGLGIKFLKHIERTRILVHLIDISSIDIEHPADVYNTINMELKLYSNSLAQKPQIIVLNKMDLPGSEKTADIFQSTVKKKNIILISAITGNNINNLILQIIKLLNNEDE